MAEFPIIDLSGESERLRAAEEVCALVPAAALAPPMPLEKRGTLEWVQSPMHQLCLAYDRWKALTDD